MQPSDISVITSSQYGFKVFDWDDNRGGTDGAGTVHIAKVEFKSNPDVNFINFCSKYGVAIENRNLTEDTTAQQIAEIFSEVIKKYQNTVINGNTYQPTSVHVQGRLKPAPFLFIMGEKV